MALYAHANPATLIDPSGHSAQAKHDGHASGSTADEKREQPAKFAPEVHRARGLHERELTRSAGQASAGGSVPPATPPTATSIGHIMVDPFGIPLGERDAIALYEICREGVDAATESACASYRAWSLVGHLERLDLHMALDAMGFVPLAGALADLTSGRWKPSVPLPMG